MKLHLHSARNGQLFTAYGPGYLEVNGARYAHPLLLLPDREPGAWDVSGFAALSARDTGALLGLAPEIIVFGSGPRHLLPGPELLAALAGSGVGFEVMGTAAGCRTYNILAGEGRRVLAAMFPP